MAYLEVPEGIGCAAWQQRMNEAPMKLVGRVRSGLGDCGQWIAKYADVYARRTGLDLFPGTLNVELLEAFDVPPGSDRLERGDYGGEVDVSIIPCRVFGRRAVILRTDANQNGTGPHPRTIVEVATDIGLRDEFGLVDGDEITIEIDAPGSRRTPDSDPARPL